MSPVFDFLYGRIDDSLTSMKPPNLVNGQRQGRDIVHLRCTVNRGHENWFSNLYLTAKSEAGRIRVLMSQSVGRNADATGNWSFQVELEERKR